MDIKEVIKNRHSVRQFKNQPIQEDIREQLGECLEEINQKSGLHLQIMYDEADCFQSLIANYGKFRDVSNYIAVVGKKNEKSLDEKCGYYGEKLVLKAQELGLNTCWVGGTYGKRKCSADVKEDEKLVCVIALGYGKNQGIKHQSKPLFRLCNVKEQDMPKWFKDGMKAAMMAPTALNQQKFYVELSGEDVTITAGKGFFSKVDLGIVKYHFEAVSGHTVR